MGSPTELSAEEMTREKPSNAPRRLRGWAWPAGRRRGQTCGSDPKPRLLRGSSGLPGSTAQNSPLVRIERPVHRGRPASSPLPVRFGQGWTAGGGGAGSSGCVLLRDARVWGFKNTRRLEGGRGGGGQSCSDGANRFQRRRTQRRGTPKASPRRIPDTANSLSLLRRGSSAKREGEGGLTGNGGPLCPAHGGSGSGADNPRQDRPTLCESPSHREAHGAAGLSRCCKCQSETVRGTC